MLNFFESYLKYKGYDIHSESQKLKRIQALNSEEFYEWQHAQKWKIAKYHYKNNSLYRSKVGKHFPSDWNDLPIMEKSDFQDDLESMLSVGFNKKNTYISNTSGSSGHPFFFAKNKEAHAMDWALIKDRYDWHNLTLSSKQARFYGIPMDRWSYSKEKAKDLLMNRVRFPVFDLSNIKLDVFSERFRMTEFEYIYGYANSLVIFAQHLITNKIVLKDLCPSLKCCIATSEVLAKENRRLLCKAFGVSIVNEYGASEIGIIAFNSKKGEWPLSEEILFHEVINGKNSANDNDGELILTDLDNLAMPFIRYKIGDVGSFSEHPVYKGKYKTLLRLSGRVNDTIVLPSGKKSPGLTFYYVSRSLLESSCILKEFIIRQTKIDTFIFEVIADRDLTINQINTLKLKVEIYLEPGLNLIIKRVSTIERPASGKIKHFYSEIK